MKRGFCFIGVALVLIATASASSKKLNDQRIKAIWTVVENRLTSQTDVWFKDGDYPSCITLLQFQNREDPANYDIATSLGWMQENVNRYDEALVTYVRFRKENPNDKDAPFPEAFFYFQQKAYAKVPPLLDSTIKDHPHPDSYRLLAHSYEKLGLYADAIKVWKDLLGWHPDDGAAKINLKRDEGKLSAPAR